MVQTARRNRPVRRTARLVLERRLIVAGRAIALCLVVDFEFVAVRIVESIGGTMAFVAVIPADTGTKRIDRFDAPLKRLRAGRAIAGVADACRL